jgi:hypothetical protein
MLALAISFASYFMELKIGNGNQLWHWFWHFCWVFFLFLRSVDLVLRSGIRSGIFVGVFFFFFFEDQLICCLDLAFVCRGVWYFCILFILRTVKNSFHGV